ncbi:hypothetical protein NM688_g5177 [Phlebia brevispora]|uniref:Uncharacterized protein n=1 Tax=Phlebia brevispora TaxID=194682 RepID=A0ACC1SZF6_9APHY|nr:hypothetical protein NM688_g5177 [Phlebia brevispora]
MNALEAACPVHEIRGLGIKTEGRKQNVFKGVKSREGEKGQDQGDGEQEEGEGLPSSYCTISLNDELVYETRVKPITSAPIFNAGTERFVRDWRSAHIAVAVKDSRMRENDAVLGVVMLKLSDLLANASQITRLYSLENGIGYGRIRISVLFRPVEAKLPPCLLGFDTGTLVVHDLSIRLSEKMDMDLTKCEVRLKTTNSGADEKVSSEAAHRKEDGSVMWGVQDSDIVDLPVRARYGSALIMSFRDLSSFGLKHTARKALAVLWLRDLVDNHEDTVQVPLWHVSDGDYSRLKMNYSPPDGDLEGWAQERERMHRAGSAFVHVVFRPGISGMHHDTMRERGAKKREAWEVFTREQEGGLRDSVGEISVDQNGTHSDAENRDTDKNDRARLQEASTSMSPPVDAAKQTPSQTDDTHREESDNTLVSPRSTERIEHGDSGTDDNPDNAKELDGSRSGQDGEEKTGMIGKFKNWRRQEKELHREHKGIMQMKPARTAEWIKDSLEEGIHDAKHRFSMKGQKPGVETEV